MSAPPEAMFPRLPRDDEGPVFAEPWQAQAFAMVVELHQAGQFSWVEWAGALTGAIRDAREAGDPDLGDTYYLHWLTALERIVTEKGIVTPEALSLRKAEWAEAAEHTPHGAPITLRHPPA